MFEVVLSIFVQAADLSFEEVANFLRCYTIFYVFNKQMLTFLCHSLFNYEPLKFSKRPLGSELKIFNTDSLRFSAFYFIKT